MIKHLQILFFYFLLFPILLFAQQKNNAVTILNADTLKSIQKDSSLTTDSLKQKKKFDVDAVINASAKDSLIFNVKKKKMAMYGSGELKYKTTDLKSGKIFIDYEKNELEAFALEDTSDTAKVKIKETPHLTEGGETFEGSYIRHNFKTQRGFISLAKNKEKEQRYEGEKVKKVDKTTAFIEHGMFTSCDSDTPHTYFSASQMKVIQKDKIIAKWIFMNVAGVPFPIPLPFAVIPNETGRRSGIIIPSYGADKTRGQYFYNFGYFWAMNDYMDLALTGDYYAKGGWGARSRFRYAKRYDFNGSFDAGLSKIIVGEANDPSSKKQNSTNWNLSWNHSQIFTPTMQMSARLQFASSDYLRTNGIDYNTLLMQQIVSAANFSKSWENSSLSINYDRTQYLDKKQIDESLPNISYSQNVFYPFRSSSSFNEGKQKWYELVGISYSGQFSRRSNTDSIKTITKMGAQHSVSLNFSPKIGYINIAPNFSYQEKWYNKRLKLENKKVEFVNPKTGKTEIKNVVDETTINELNFVRTFSSGVSASTKLYGVMNPNLFGVESFRHSVTPSISYNYQPDFSQDNWGYYDSYTDSTGKQIKYDKYRNEIYGGTGGGRSQSINFSVGNVFEIKMAKTPGDTLKEQKKIQLLNLDASLGYNFAADEFKLSDLSLNYRTQIGDILSLDGGSSYTFYNFNDNTKVNSYLVSSGKGLFRITDFRFSVSTSLAGEKLKTSSEEKPKAVEETEEQINNRRRNSNSIFDETQTPDLTIPWNLNLGYSYNFSKPYSSIGEVFSNLNADLSFSLTKNWKFTVRGSYDFKEKRVSAPQITVYRDLHCWEMNFTWNPIGNYGGFRFEIRMKAPELQDIKVTKSEGLYSGRR